MLTVAVKERVTENDYGGDTRNRKRLRWRIVGPWQFSERSPLSSTKWYVLATMAKNAPVNR